MARRGALTLLAGLACVGCGAPRRPQLVVTVRSDLALPGQLVADETLSPAASIHRVRVDVFGPDAALVESREFPLGETAALPLTFGVAPATPGGRVSLRVSGYRPGWDTPGVAIDRLFTSAVSRFESVDLVLRGDCLGWPADPIGGLTCVDGARPSTAADGAVDTALPEPGSWAPARSTPCVGKAPAETVCIPGGVSSIGDPALQTVDAVSDLVPAPPRTVILSPFFLDETEMTVARLRALVTKGLLTGPLPTPDSVDPFCNYTPLAGASENEAVRCVAFDTARAACRALGGDLPTAAQWEHAARGRGRGTRYPWGDAPPSCCAAAIAGFPFDCKPSRGVGTHADPSRCDGLADKSRDGVLDLGGSAREWVLDAAVSFDDCLGPGVLQDPLCEDSLLGPGSSKGGSVDTPREGATLALRRSGKGNNNKDLGFRCVRP